MLNLSRKNDDDELIIKCGR